MSSITLRFLAEPGTDLAGKVRGGIVMKWIDEAGYACASAWAQRACVTVFVAGTRFHRPIRVGELVEVEARLAHTGSSSMAIAVEVRSGDLKSRHMHRTTECVIVFAAVDGEGNTVPVDKWTPETPGEVVLAARAKALLDAARAAAGG